jgi:hypothetical protein
MPRKMYLINLSDEERQMLLEMTARAKSKHASSNER